MRWAMSIVRFGLQLPMEDIDLIQVASKKYNDIFFVLYQLELSDFDKDDKKMVAMLHRSMVELICRTSTLFNPRCFFEDELPLRTIKNQYRDRVVHVRDSCVFGKRETRSKASDQSNNDADMQDRKPADSAKSQQHSEAEPAEPVGNANIHLPENLYDQEPNSSTKQSMGTGTSSGGLDKKSVALALATADQEDSSLSQGKGFTRKARPRTNTNTTADTTTTIRSTTSTLAAETHPLVSKARLAGALVLWDRYVQLLERMMQTYSTMIRTIQQDTPVNVVISITERLLLVVDLILSQKGGNPRLQRWTEKYKPVIGSVLWDKTWGTIGERLEYSAIKLAIDVWGRVISMPNVPNDVLLRCFHFWLHREKVLDTWLQLLGQIANRVLHAHYPNDPSIGGNIMHVRIMDFSIVGTTTDNEAKAILRAYAQTHINLDAISDHSYCLYTNHMCTVVENGLRIQKIVEKNGVHYVQRPPTANYILHYFGKPIFEIAWHRGRATRYNIEARCRIMRLLSQILILREDPSDPIRPAYLNTIISIIRRETVELNHVQAVLSIVPSLLMNSQHMRPFITQFLCLVCKVIPRISSEFKLVLSQTKLRHSAYEALSALIAFSGYYYSIKRSDLIRDRDGQIKEAFIRSITQQSTNVESQHCSNSIRDVVSKSVLEDAVLSEYLQIYYKILLSSVVIEKETGNLQYLTCVIVTFLHQYSEFNPEYVQIFVEFYVEQLQNTRDEKLAAAYIYGLIQAAMVTWKGMLSDQHYRVIFTALVHGLSNCDKNLKRYTHWNQYHQVFISSVRCLSIWISAVPSHGLFSQDLVSELMALLHRCNAFMSSSIPENQIKVEPLGRKLQVVSSTETHDSLWYPDFTAKLSSTISKPGFQTSEGDRNQYFTSYTALGGLSLSDGVQKSNASEEKAKQTPNKRVLSDSLYKVLSTTIAVYSMFLLRGIDKYQLDTSLLPQDALLMRNALYSNTVPDNSVVLSGCGEEVEELLKDYRPVSVSFYSGYYRTIYSTINFQRFENGKWSDSIDLNISRYPSGSKLWVTMTTNPMAETIVDSSSSKSPAQSNSKNSDASNYPSNEGNKRSVESAVTQPWIRMTEGMISNGPLRSTFDILDMSGHIRHVRPIVDDEGEQAMEERTADEFKRLHNARAEPDVHFPQARPLEYAPRGRKHIRKQLYEHQIIDWSFLSVSEPMLRELDFLDDLDPPFSAFAGIVYLRSADSLTVERTMAKGPIKGISPEFSRFLASLGRNRSAPVERMKRYPDDPLLIRYSFKEQSFQVSYDLAPNVGSLISGCTMRQRDNERFYKLLYDRGIYVMWFDIYQGDLDHQLAWQFLDSCYSVVISQAQGTQGTQGTQGQERSRTESSQAPPASRSPNILFTSDKPLQNENNLSGIEGRTRSATTQPDYASASSPDKKSRLHESSKASDVARTPGADHGFHKPKAIGLFQRAIGMARREHAAEETHTLSRSTSEPHSASKTKIAPCIPTTEPKEQQQQQQQPHPHRDHQPCQQAQSSTDYSDTLVGLKEALRMSIDKNTSLFEKMQDEGKPKETESSTPISPVFRSPANARTFSESEAHRNEGLSVSGSPRSSSSEFTNKVRLLIALAPIPHTGGRLVKITMSANDSSKQMNNEFIRMTGPLMPSMVVEAKNLASLLSATVMDASANIASLRCEDFSVVSRRVEMITSIIESFSVKHRSISDAHKFMYPVGKSGVQNTFDIPCSTIASGSARNSNDKGKDKGKGKERQWE
ncbi:hypothetical protein LPJ64_000416 [Coemansia asiatica]|uniref:Uncharacterized protein n=1 Tax=Coemansia asiatica TaxID=1052880 RepID=A0A9W7XRY6_9FUNG|nr:hypothetical protein LPJ64_000416 [Coemansia asiatica]